MAEDLRSRIEAKVAERRVTDADSDPDGVAGRHAFEEVPQPSANGHRSPAANGWHDAASAGDTVQIPRFVNGPADSNGVAADLNSASTPAEAPPTEAPPAVAPPAEAPTEVRPPAGRARPHTGVRRLLSQFLILIVVAAAATFALRTWVVEPFWIPSESMEPTLHGCAGCNDDRLLVDKLSYKLHSVHRGDVVVFSRPPDFATSEDDLVKRVVGLPGETVSAHGGQVWVGNRPLKEPYVAAACHGTADFAPVRIPAKDVFVMGDNRCDSSDSRVFGPIPESSIVGRAFVVFWPWSRLHWL